MAATEKQQASQPDEPTDRHLIARIASNERWARADGRDGRRRATSAARSAFFMKLERQAEAEAGQPLEPEERARRAHHLLRAHMARCALESIRIRRIKAIARRTAQADADGGSE